MPRRIFLKGLLATAASTIVAVVSRAALPTPALAAPRPKAFEFHHDGATAIVITRAQDPERLDIEVRRVGATVEHHESVHSHRLHKLRSGYFSVTYHDPPTA